MRTALVLLFSVLLPMTVVHAKGRAEPAQDDDVQVVKRSAIYEDSSEHNRMGKQYQLNAQLWGVGPSLASASGLQFGYFLDRSSLIMAEATSGNSGWGSTLGSNYSVKSSSFGVHYKRYQGNSFYWRGGVDYRTGSVDYKYVSLVSSTYDLSRSFSSHSVALNFQIGNQWQWENFTLGCDWVGYSLPVSSTITSESLSGNVTSYDIQNQKNDQDDLIKNGHINLLRFYLGASF